LTKVTQLSFLGDAKIIDTPDQENLPKTYKGLYAMHKYWSKKPYNLIASYIERFSSPGDIVIDSFCGSGVTVVESVRLGRRAIGIDINPTAVLVTQMGLSHLDIWALQRDFDALRKEIKPTIDALYRTGCLRCGNPNAIVTHTIWEDEQPKEVWYECSQCGDRKGIRVGSASDLQAAYHPKKPSSWYPTTQLIENSRINAKAGMQVSDLFTPRALVGLSLLLERIRQIKDDDTRSVLEFCFNASLPQASKMVFVIRRRGKTSGSNGQSRAEVGSWVIGYWVPAEHFEINVWRCFENRFKRVKKGKKEVNAVIPASYVPCFNFEDVNQVKEGYWVEQGTATDLPIPDSTIDYVLVDPPHGNRMPYLELSLMWNSWLGLTCDWEQEIVVSESKSRQKDIQDYQERIAVSLGELWRVLKPEKCASIIFNSLDDETWLSLLNACLAAGFVIREIQPLAYSANSVIQDTRKQALKTDFVITCQKQAPRRHREVEFINDDSELVSEISEYLTRHENGAETFEILNHLFVSGVPREKIYRVSTILNTLETSFKFKQGRWHL
jgi:16S rRNA G966 N2-methylase RsmD